MIGTFTKSPENNIICLISENKLSMTVFLMAPEVKIRWNFCNLFITYGSWYRYSFLEFPFFYSVWVVFGSNMEMK